MAKVRKMCDCEAQTHKLINNCISCGKIVCSLEGEGPCLFCGNPIQRKGEVNLDDSQFPDMESKSAYSKAILHKDKLLDFHRRDVHQSNIIDDQADYYQIVDDVWQNEEIRSQAIMKIFQQQEAEATNTVKQVLDLETMQFNLVTEKTALDNDVFREEAQTLLREAEKKKNGVSNMSEDCQKIYNDVSQSLKKESKQKKKNTPLQPASCKVQFNDEYFQDFQKELSKIKDQEIDQSQYDESFYQLENGIGCLSMHQPWAQLVIEGFKRIEGRQWGTNYKGPLWIHAGAKQPDTELISAIEYQYKELYKNCEKVPQLPSRYPTGALIGVVDMVGFVRAAEYNKLVPKEQQEEGDTEFKFVFRNPRKLMYPIQMRGSNNIFKLDEEIRLIAMKSLQRIPIKWGPYLIDPKQVAEDPVIEKEKSTDDSMQKISEQFVVKESIKQPEIQPEKEVPQQQPIQQEAAIEKAPRLQQVSEGQFEKQVEWGILIKNVLKKDQLLRIANFLSSKIKKQNTKGLQKQQFVAKGMMPCHDMITNVISTITGNLEIYNECVTYYLKLSDKKLTIQNATALLVIGQDVDIVCNNQQVQLTQGKVLLVEEGFTLNVQFGNDQQQDNILRDISQDYIAPSILTCDFSIFYEECDKLLKFGVDWLHLDVMDGHFVPNLTFGPPVIKSLTNRLQNRTFIDLHCMIQEPRKWVKDLANAGGNQMTVHYEADIGNIEELSQMIRQAGMRPALALKPKTLIDHTLIEIFDKSLFDMILIMTVEPGFGGQKFMADMLPKVTQLRQKYPKIDIQVDGGVNCENVVNCYEAGANVIVSGSGIVNAKDPKQSIECMKQLGCTHYKY